MTLTPGVGHAEPSIDEVERRLDSLYHEAEAAQERLNTLNHRTQQTRERLVTLRADLRKQRQRYQRFGNQVAGIVAADAQNAESQLSPTQRLLLAESPDEFLDDMAAEEALSSHQGALLAEFSATARRMALRERQVGKELAKVADARRQAAKEEQTVDAKVADAEDLLSELEAERRAELRRQRALEAREASRSAARPAPVAVSGGAAAAVEFGLAQVGDAYVYGAAGPDAWDCSGLTMGAWAAAGVSLPHSSSAQMSSGPSVSMSELQPGDLVFYYDPVSHVGMYIGNGQIVHASNPSDPVNVAPVDSMPFSGAVRPG